MKSVLERFLTYVKIDTESKAEEEQVPSTKKQWDLARLLAKELNEMGAYNVRLEEHCYVYATIPATVKEKLPSLGFIAHLDTSPAISGANVKPRVIEKYDGKDIELNKAKGIHMTVAKFPFLSELAGQTLVVTDGTTLLGADDKSGIAAIMNFAEILLSNPDIKHGPVQIGFTPDEEVGRGADFFDVEGFMADFAYTLDGGTLGELEYENFNAASAKLTINGASIHPGTSKGRMVNALQLAVDFHNLLPVFDRPEHTEGYEGFFHLSELNGSVEQANMDYIIRDHSRHKFEEKKKIFQQACDFMNQRYGDGVFMPRIRDSYYNMREKIEEAMHLVDNAIAAMESLHIKPLVVPIRGGTDGARLSYMGLPCPNLFVGGHNGHGKYECVTAEDMEKAVQVMLKLVEAYSK